MNTDSRTREDIASKRADRVLRRSAEICGKGDLVSTFPSKYWPGRIGNFPDDGTMEYMRERAGDVTSVAVYPEMQKSRLWDHVYGCPYCEGASIPVYDRKTLPPLRSENEDWESILSCLNHVGRPSGEGEFMRPEGPWITDLVKSGFGFEFLEAAHALHHMRKLATPDGERVPDFLECLAELDFAKRFGYTFKVPSVEDIASRKYDRRRIPSDIDSMGVRFAVSTNVRKPWLSMDAVGTDGLYPYRDAIVVSYGIHLEPQPWSARADNPNDSDEAWLEMNRWSCMPSLLVMNGWIAADELMKMPLVRRYSNSKQGTERVMAPVTALDGPSSLDNYLEHGLVSTGNEEDPSVGLYTYEGFAESDLFARMRMATPPFPCKECLRLNMASEGAPTRPLRARPDDDDRHADHEAVEEWRAYDEKVDKIFRVVEKACSFYDGRFGEGRAMRKDRERTAKRVAELSERSEKLLAKERKLRRDMELTKARELEGMRSAVMAEIACLVKGEQK